MAGFKGVGVFVPQGWRMDLVNIEDPVEQYEAMSRAAVEAERLGYDSIWLYDHFHTVPKPELETTFECWTATAALARDTKTVRIGQMVTCNGYRNPAYLAKVASTVDVLSRGRLDFGLGAGWYEHEWLAYGYGFPDAPTRLKMLGDALPIIKAMWTEDYATYEGKYHSVNGAINEPKGVQKPHPPIWIGGGGEKVTLKLCARYADYTNYGGSNPQVFTEKSEILKQHCETVGRNFDEITRSSSLEAYVLGPNEQASEEMVNRAFGGARSLESFQRDAFVGSAQQVIDKCGELIDAGSGYLIVYVPDIAYNLEPLQRFAEEVLPHIRG